MQHEAKITATGNQRDVHRCCTDRFMGLTSEPHANGQNRLLILEYLLE